MSDLISRQAAIKKIRSMCGVRSVYTGWRDPNGAEVEDALKQLPSAEKKGKWKDIDLIGYKAICSECGVWSLVMGNYCPNCGARMERSEE